MSQSEVLAISLTHTPTDGQAAPCGWGGGTADIIE